MLLDLVAGFSRQSYAGLFSTGVVTILAVEELLPPEYALPHLELVHWLVNKLGTPSPALYAGKDWYLKTMTDSLRASLALGTQCKGSLQHAPAWADLLEQVRLNFLDKYASANKLGISHLVVNTLTVLSRRISIGHGLLWPMFRSAMEASAADDSNCSNVINTVCFNVVKDVLPWEHHAVLFLFRYIRDAVQRFHLSWTEPWEAIDYFQMLMQTANVLNGLNVRATLPVQRETYAIRVAERVAALPFVAANPEAAALVAALIAVL